MKKLTSTDIIKFINNLKYGKSKAEFNIKSNRHVTDLFKNTYKVDSDIECFSFEFYYKLKPSIMNIFMIGDDIWFTINEKLESGIQIPITKSINIKKGKLQIKEAIYSKIKNEAIRTKNRNYKAKQIKYQELDYSQMANL